MKFFNIKDLAKSWSIWSASAVAIVPMVDMSTGLFSFIPEQYKPLAVTALGLLTIVLRAIKQVNTVFHKDTPAINAISEIVDASEEVKNEAKAKVEKFSKDAEHVVSVAKKAGDVVKVAKETKSLAETVKAAHSIIG